MVDISAPSFRAQIELRRCHEKVREREVDVERERERDRQGGTDSERPLINYVSSPSQFL